MAQELFRRRLEPRSNGPRIPEIGARYAVPAYVAMLVPILASPFGTVLSLSFVTFGALFGLWKRGELYSELGRWDQVSVSILAFAAAASVSALWSPAEIETLGKAAVFATIAISTIVGVNSGTRSTLEVSAAATRAFVLVFAILGGRAVIEILTDQAMLKTYYDVFGSARDADLKHLRIEAGQVTVVNEIFLNRHVYVVTLFALPAWIGAGVFASPNLRMLARAAIAMVLMVVLFGSQHESSKLAIVCSIVVLVACWASYRGAVAMVGASWLAAVLLVVPVALALGSMKLDEASWLPTSARDRVKIWRQTAQRTLQLPILGHGAGTTHVHYERELAASLEKLDLAPAERDLRLRQFRRERLLSDRLGPHAHNVYLQVWFELGLAGALLLTAAGAIILRQITRLQTPGLRNIGLVQFTAVAASAATSYSLWQPWFMSVIGLSLIFMAIAARAVMHEPAAYDLDRLSASKTIRSEPRGEGPSKE